MLSKTSRFRGLRIGLVAVVLACCPLALWGDGNSLDDDVEEVLQDTFTWKALPYVFGETLVCWLEPSGEPGIEEVVCYDSCPSRGICAEFSNRHGVVDLVCCIDPDVEGSSTPGDCLLEATLIRGGGGPPEAWDIPWM